MVKEPQGIPTLQVLLNVFGAKNIQDSWSQTEVVLRIGCLLSAELSSLTEESRKLDFSQESREPIVVAFARLSIGGMLQPWQQHHALFQASLPLLRIFGEGLPDEGASISPDDLLGLQNAIDNFREDIERSSLSGFLGLFVYQQLAIIERAIQDYPLAGTKAFRTATKDFIFHQAENSDVAKQVGQTEQGTRLKAIWQKVRDLSKYTIEFSKLLAAGDSIREHGEQIVNTVTHVVEHHK